MQIYKFAITDHKNLNEMKNRYHSNKIDRYNNIKWFCTADFECILMLRCLDWTNKIGESFTFSHTWFGREKTITKNEIMMK